MERIPAQRRPHYPPIERLAILGDGHGLEADTVLSCAAPSHYVGTGDDCDDSDLGAWSVPTDVGGLRLTSIPGGSRLDWEPQTESAGSATRYDVVTGDLGSLRSTKSFSGAVCLASGLDGPTYDDTRPPPAVGGGSYYLPRARNGCGSGTHGDASFEPDPRDLLDSAGPCP